MARIRSVHPDALKSDKPRRKANIVGSVRAEVAARYGCPKGERIEVGCHYCGAPGFMRWFWTERSRTGWVSLLYLEWDHVVPESRGGPTTADNLVVACQPCNRRKGSKVAA